jgi:dCMP deaminase
MDRPSREQTFMEVARVFARRSTCRRGQVGAVLVRDRRIIATGYNGAPSGARNCLELGCLVPEENPDLGCQRSIHAEANIIAYTARHQGGALGSTLYSTASPCLKCAQLIAAAGIEKVIYENPYRITDGMELLDSLFIPCIQFAWTPIESDKNDRA